MNTIIFLLKSFLLLNFTLELKVLATGSFVVTPNKKVHCHEGSNVTLEWLFDVGSWSNSPAKVGEFLFGFWKPPGFVREKILAVFEHNLVVKQRGYEGKVDWSGSIYDCVNCTAKITLYNVTAADFKTYGVEVEPLELDKSPLTDWVTLEKIESTTTPPTEKKTSNESTTTPLADENGLSPGEKVGIGVGVVGFVILVIIIIIIIYPRIENQDARNGEQTENVNSSFLEYRSERHVPDSSSNTADECD